MAVIKKQVCISPLEADFVKKRRYISLSKICQRAIQEEMRKEGIALSH